MNLKQLSLAKVYKVAAVLLLLALGSSMLATAPLAKYVTGASGSDSARVAKFSVSSASSGESATNRDIKLDSSTTTGTYNFTVTSDSEVATTYDVKVTVQSALQGVTPSLKVGDEEAKAYTSLSSDSLTYTWKAAGSFTAGSSQTANLQLIFTKASDANKATYENIKVEAVVTQVD